VKRSHPESPESEIDPTDALEPYLYEGETLVWAGRPMLKRFKGEIAGEFVFGMILAAVGSFVFILFAFMQLTHGGVGAAGLAMCGVVSLVFMLAGASGMTAPKRYRRLLAETVYGVTDERAMMVKGFGHSRMANISTFSDSDRFFSVEKIKARELKRRDGSGDIVFDHYFQRSNKGGDYRVDVGFIGVDNVDEVDRLLAKIEFGAKKPLHEDLED
jgi:hypothetical protein